MSTFGQALVSYAKSKLGQKEQGGENMGPIVDWSFALWTKRKPDETGWGAWCASFVSTCVYYTLIDQARLQEAKDWLKIGSTEVTPIWNRLAAKDLIVPGKECEVGDLIFFGPGPGNFKHIGLVAGVEKDSEGNITLVRTVEGNCADSVKERSYKPDITRIYGYIRLPY